MSHFGTAFGLLIAASLWLTKGIAGDDGMAHMSNPQDFQVIELRRYTIKPGEREHFAIYFESYFPEAFQQQGAIAFGQFFERKNQTGFTWLRGFKTIEARAIVNSAFYYGAVWKEHSVTMNSLMDDSDNVLLLHPVTPTSGIPVLPAVDPVREPSGAQGIVVAQIFAVADGKVDALAEAARGNFAQYRSAGAREAGLLVTLDVRNNFPQLPFRTDGPYLVWLGVVKDERSLRSNIVPLAEQAAKSLAGSPLLRDKPELVILDPTHRSRLRWLE